MASDKVSKIIIVFMGQMFNLLLLFLLTPYLSRSLSKHEFGTFSQVQLISTLVVALFSMGLSRIFYLVIEKKDFEKKDAFKTIMLLAFAFGAMASVASFFSSGFLSTAFGNPDLHLPLAIYAPFFLINSVNLLLELTLIHKGLVRRDMTILIVSNVVKLTLLLISIQVWKSFTFIFWTIGTIAPLIQMMLYLANIPMRDFTEGSVNAGITSFIIKIGTPLGITSVLAASYTYLAGFFVSSMFTTSEFAIYRNGSIEIPFLGIISTSVASILTPQFANMLAEGKRSEVVNMKKMSISEVAAITYPIIIITLFFARDFLVLYLSEKYADSTMIFFIYTLILFIRVNSYEDVLTGLGKSTVILKANVIYFVVNIILIYIFIRWIGLIGAAIASVLSVYLLAYLLLRSTARSLGAGLSDIINLSKLGRIIIYSVLFAGLIKLADNVIHNNSVKISMILIYFGAIYFVFIRSKILNIQLYERVFITLPYGRNIYKFLSR